MWIQTIPPREAEGALEKLYRDVQTPDGHVDRLLVAHSLRPRTLAGHLALYKAVLHTRDVALSPRERELVGVVVSHLNGCAYCVAHHTAGLARHVGDEATTRDLVREAVGEREGEVMTGREHALIAYATKLTRSPETMTQDDLHGLRAMGLADGEILDLNQIVAYFAYANRTVQGLGVTADGEPLGLHPSEASDDMRHA